MEKQKLLKKSIILQVKTKNAFTFVELLVSIMILAILGTVSFLNLQSHSIMARDSARLSDINNAIMSIEAFYLNSGTYPEPDNYIIYSGSTIGIKQGVIGEGVVRKIGLDKIIKDPLTQENFVYSMLSGGKYYQISSQGEGSGLSILEKLYASNLKTSIVRGNYKFDPSLPGLILVPSSITGSGIFDPNVCFVMDGGVNTIYNCREVKKDMDLAKYDDRLVGYWDMETQSGTTLLDLSRTGHDATFSGTYTTLTGGILGNALQFQSGGFIIGNSQLYNDYKNLTIKIDFYTLYDEYDTHQSFNELMGDYITYHNIINRRNCSVTCTTPGSFWLGMSDINAGASLYNSGIGIQGYDGELTPYAFKNITNTKIMGTKKWYELIIEKQENTNLRIYLNQQLILENKFTNEILSSDQPFYIGTTGHTLDKKQSPGIIDDIKFYNTILSDNEKGQQAKISGF